MKPRCLSVTPFLAPALNGWAQDFINGQSANVIIDKPNFVTSATPPATNTEAIDGVFVDTAIAETFACGRQNNRVPLQSRPRARQKFDPRSRARWTSGASAAVKITITRR